MVRVGVSGLGGMAHRHAECITDLGHTVAGGFDVEKEARRRFERAFGAPPFASFEDLLAEDIDAVVITTPNCFHEEYAVRALNEDIAVLCEKPLAHTLESAERIATAAEESNAFCMVGFHNRYSAPAEVVRARIENGLLGEVNHVDANYIRRRGVPGRGSWFTRKDAAGGGALVDIGVHAIDLSLHLLGFPEVTEVLATTRSDFGPREDYVAIESYGEDNPDGEFNVDDSATALIQCENGATIALDAAWAVNRPPCDTFTVQGTNEGAQFALSGDEVTVYGTGTDGVPHLADTTVTPEPVEPKRREQADFLSAVERGVYPKQNTVQQALTVQRVIDAAYRSSESGTAVTL